MESSLARLQGQVPDLPITQILISRLLVHMGRELSTMIDQRLRPHGLTDLEFRALTLVHHAPHSAVFPSALCLSLAQSAANITRLTDTLVERGLISRVPDELDRRRLVLKTTPKGEQLVDELLPVMVDAIHHSYRGLSQERLQQILDGLKQLAQAIDQAGGQAETPAMQPE